MIERVEASEPRAVRQTQIFPERSDAGEEITHVGTGASSCCDGARGSDLKVGDFLEIRRAGILLATWPD